MGRKVPWAQGQQGRMEEGQESVTGSVCREGNAGSGSPGPIKPPVSGQGQGTAVGLAVLGTVWWLLSGLGGFGRWLCPGKGRRLRGTPSPAGIPRHRPAMLQSQLSLAAARVRRAPRVSAIPLFPPLCPPRPLPGPPPPLSVICPHAVSCPWVPFWDNPRSCPKSPKLSLLLPSARERIPVDLWLLSSLLFLAAGVSSWGVLPGFGVTLFWGLCGGVCQLQVHGAELLVLQAWGGCSGARGGLDGYPRERQRFVGLVCPDR